MKHLLKFNESIESEVDTISSALIMAFDDRSVEIDEVDNLYIYINDRDNYFRILPNANPRIPGSENKYEIHLSFMMSNRVSIEACLRYFYRRISRFGWSKTSEEMKTANGYKIDRSNSIRHHAQRVTKIIQIQKANKKRK